jgi:hypothetical protein
VTNACWLQVKLDKAPESVSLVVMRRTAAAAAGGGGEADSTFKYWVVAHT